MFPFWQCRQLFTSENRPPEQASLKGRKWIDTSLVDRRTRFIWCNLQKWLHRYTVQWPISQQHAWTCGQQHSAHQLSNCFGCHIEKEHYFFTVRRR
jgi:hypothetical protein